MKKRIEITWIIIAAVFVFLILFFIIVHIESGSSSKPGITCVEMGGFCGKSCEEIALRYGEEFRWKLFKDFRGNTRLPDCKEDEVCCTSIQIVPSP